MTTSSTSELLNELRAAGLRVWAEDGRVCVHPGRKMTAEMVKRVRAQRVELLDELEWNWWACLEPEDYRRLTTTPQRPGPCAFCKGISRHSRQCDELRASWAVMGWGKHKGKHVSAVSEDYLRFVLSRRFGTSNDRQMILDELRRRRLDEYDDPQWTARALDERESSHE